MNAPLRENAEPRLEDFPFRVTDNVRYADLDPNQHVNNAVYASYFETGRVTLMKDRSRGLMPPGLSWMMVRLDMHFRAELRWPGTIEMGLGLVKFGRTSVTFDQVVFSKGKCVASAQSVSVLIDESSQGAPHGHRYAFLGRDGVVLLTLWQQASDGYATERSGLHHLSFQVDTIDEVREAESALKELGVTFQYEGVVPHREGAASGGIFFTDPDGIRLEIFAAVGAAGQEAPRGEAPTCGFF